MDRTEKTADDFAEPGSRIRKKTIFEAAVSPGEDETLAQEKKRLQSADKLIQMGSESLTLLHDTVIDSLARVKKNLEQMAALDEGIAGHADQVADHYFQLEDQAAELHDYLQSIPNDPAQLETIDARLDLLTRLKRKYSGPS